MNSQPPSEVQLSRRLRDLLNEHFDYNELCDLCYDLGIDYEKWHQLGTTTMAREIVRYCKRRGMMIRLVIYCREQRPHGEWPLIEHIQAIFPGALDEEGPTEVINWPHRTVTAALILVILLIAAVFTPAVRGVFIPPTPTPIVGTPPPRPPLRWYNLGDTRLYTDTAFLFKVQLPQEWQVYKSEEASSPIITRVTFAPQAQPDLYWRMSIELGDVTKMANISTFELPPHVKSYVGTAYSNFPGLEVGEPVYTSDLQTVRVEWSFIIDTSENTTIRMRAITDVRIKGHVMSVFTLYAPSDQFDRQEDAIKTLSDSLVISPSLEGRGP